MAYKLKMALPLVFTVLSGVLAAATPGFAYDEPSRTAHRSVLGYPVYPDWIFSKPEHYEFSPLVSNSDPLTQHPNQWDGQDWDPKKWNKNWTPEIAIQKFYNARIFTNQYMSDEHHLFSNSDAAPVPVVELGPTFYKLSDLDQRRTLKLLADYFGLIGKSSGVVELVDWSTHDVVGVYTPKGMFLN
jgi:hypothetical protein